MKTYDIVIIGGGPAGLSCAFYLATRGYKPTVFEKNERPGGMLVYGIPSFKLEKNVVDAEIEVMRELGVDIKCGVEVGKDISLDELRAQGRKLTLIGKEDVLYPERTAVVPSYLAKGLEFDLVIIADPLDSWKSDAEKKALFVSASRALHKLYVLRPEKGKKRKK